VAKTNKKIASGILIHNFKSHIWWLKQKIIEIKKALLEPLNPIFGG